MRAGRAADGLTPRRVARPAACTGQPLPDIFLLAAEREGVAPSECVVVEDSTSGVRSAQAAEMEVVGYLGGGHAQAEWYREKLADFGIPLTYTDDELLAYLQR